MFRIISTTPSLVFGTPAVLPGQNRTGSLNSVQRVGLALLVACLAIQAIQPLLALPWA